MKHELLIHCFGQWWQADVEDDSYSLMSHNIEVIVSPAVIFHSKLVYDKSTKKLLRNTTGTSSAQIEMEVWLLGEIPVINLERRAFERRRKSYERLKKSKESEERLINKVMNKMNK